MNDQQGSVTIKEVAHLAGVSIATVSRVLNNYVSVTQQTRRRVLDAMEQLGYNRNEVARSLKIRQTRTIGIIAPELSNVFFMEVIEAMESILAPLGYSMIIGSSNDSVAEEKRKLRVFIERNVDGLVVMPAGTQGEHFASKALSNVPLIMVDRRVSDVAADSVLTDNRYGVRQMVRALKHEGYTRIALIVGDPTVYTASERLQGFLEAMKEEKLPVETRFLFINGAMNQSAGRDLMRRALEEPDRPDAFFFANDSLHLGATIYLMEHLSPAQQEKFVFASFDYLSYAPLLRFCHYAVAQPMERIGQEVASLLLRRLNGDWSAFPAEVILKPQIKILTANGGIPFDIEKDTEIY